MKSFEALLPAAGTPSGWNEILCTRSEATPQLLTRFSSLDSIGGRQ